MYQDQVVTLEVDHQLVKDYRDNVGNDKRECITNKAIFVLVVFLVALC